MSWEIQKSKNNSRAKALSAAWSIVQNANITIFYLVEKHSNKHNKTTAKVKPENLTLSLYA
ncbi:hypothetical protein EON73_04565 [bacterium]|nr:MAG: hypothetical protein EON73_04565 [bacterium]